MENGQCDCRRHLIGRQCSEVQPGFFCAPLDYYKYEAEDAAGHSPGDSALPVSTRLSVIQCSSLIHISAQTDDKSPAKECRVGLLLQGPGEKVKCQDQSEGSLESHVTTSKTYKHPLTLVFT